VWHVIWDETNLRKIGLNEVTPEEVEEVVQRSMRPWSSRSSGRPMFVGRTSSGRLLVVPFDWIDQARGLMRPVTAFEPEEPA
jgi:hypothetical protein